VNVAIQERQEDYIQLLKKELIMAQNIIRTPALLEQTNKKFNFETMELYQRGKENEESKARNSIDKGENSVSPWDQTSPDKVPASKKE
jgi:hypothetical protein